MRRLRGSGGRWWWWTLFILTQSVSICTCCPPRAAASYNLMMISLHYCHCVALARMKKRRQPTEGMRPLLLLTGCSSDVCLRLFPTYRTRQSVWTDSRPPPLEDFHCSSSVFFHLIEAFAPSAARPTLFITELLSFSSSSYKQLQSAMIKGGEDTKTELEQIVKHEIFNRRDHFTCKNVTNHQTIKPSGPRVCWRSSASQWLQITADWNQIGSCS